MNSDVTLMRRPRSHCCIAAEVATSEGLRCKRCSCVFLALCVLLFLICEQHCKRIRLPSPGAAAGCPARGWCRIIDASALAAESCGSM